ncbi:MAG TPA: M56 family metallopeptidase, partial [Candidatus Krumholzibacteria bacterium]
MAAMLSIITLLDSIATPTAAAWLLRITLLSAMACALLMLSRRAQPALRHAVAVGSLLAVALLPAAASLLPAVSVPVLPARAVDATTPTREVMPSPMVASDPAPVEIEYVPAHYTVGAIDDGARTPAVLEEITTPSMGSRVKAFAISAVQSPTNWIRLAIVLWMLVATALLVRLAVAFRRAAALCRHSLPVDIDVIDNAVERACRVLGVSRRPHVALSSEISVPMVVGVLRPRILLPASAASWTHQRLTVVLLHEVAHIRRRDPAWMLLAQVVGATLWFHPFVRTLSVHVRHDSELACDDLVLGTGVRASDYAGHLVSIASMSAFSNTVARATLAFAARSTLEHRVMSILAARRTAASRRVTGAMAFACLALFITVSVAHPTHGTLAEYEEGKQQYEAEKAQLEQEYASGKADFEMQRSVQQAMKAAQQAQLQQSSIQNAVQAATPAPVQAVEACDQVTSCNQVTV